MNKLQKIVDALSNVPRGDTGDTGDTGGTVETGLTDRGNKNHLFLCFFLNEMINQPVYHNNSSGRWQTENYPNLAHISNSYTF